MLKLLRRLDTDTAASDARMRNAGFTVQATGRWSRTYRPSPDLKAAWAHSATPEHSDQAIPADLVHR